MKQIDMLKVKEGLNTDSVNYIFIFNFVTIDKEVNLREFNVLSFSI